MTDGNAALGGGGGARLLPLLVLALELCAAVYAVAANGRGRDGGRSNCNVARKAHIETMKRKQNGEHAILRSVLRPLGLADVIASGVPLELADGIPGQSALKAAIKVAAVAKHDEPSDVAKGALKSKGSPIKREEERRERAKGFDIV